MQSKRWYPLRPHPVQEALVNDNVRFKVVPAGRRSGKTERAKRYIAKQALLVPGPYFIAAPTRDQVKRIYWNDMCELLEFACVFKKPTTSDLTIHVGTGSTIVLIGLDKPERLEGTPWMGGVIDEIANVHSHAWSENIAPALDTVHPENPDYRPWCWLIGVPEGLNHYYDIAEYAKNSNDPDWKYYTWKSSDILPEDVIEAARRRMSPRHYRQEYEASFEAASSRVYEDYSPLNYTEETIQAHEQLYWFHDFNFSPMSSGIGVVRKDGFYILDEIVLQSAVARQSALEFVEKFKDHANKNVVIFGDPAGRAGEKHGHSSDYSELEKVLKDSGWTLTRKVKMRAPAIRDRQNAVRAKICNAKGERTLFVNPKKAEYAHKGLATTQVKDGSTFLEADSEYQHITTAIGYCCDYEWPLNQHQSREAKPLATVHYFDKLYSER